jgi:excisionase family DNA binding protein
MSGRLLTADDVAEMLGVPKSWVYEQSRRGRIPTVELGRYRRFRQEAIEEWVREQESSLAPNRRAVLGGLRQVNGRAPRQRPRPGTGGHLSHATGT